MPDQPILDYEAAEERVPVSRLATAFALAMSLLIAGLYVAFVLLRRHQLSLPDPYNNPYTNLSTACLLTLPPLAVGLGIIVVVKRKQIAMPVLVLASTELGLAGLLIGGCCFNMFRFIFP